MPWLINALQLDKFRKSQKNIFIFDASYHMQAANRNAKQEFLENHIIDAKFFDIDLFSDPNSELPHTLIQDEKIISEKLGSLGLRNDCKIIFYDNSALHSAFRAAWMMKMFGHNPQLIYVLDGGLKSWEKYDGKMESGDSPTSSKTYTAKFQPENLRTLAQMKNNLANPTEQVIDVRNPLRYAGGPEPRPGIRRGHIPGSFCLPYEALFEKESGVLLPLDKLRHLLGNIAVDFNSPIVSLCGSGITAPILDFILDLLEHKQHTVYDGSWSEWGCEKLFPGEASLDERPVKTSLD
jgi:thiosulfate/3-mercaptopyruvate sulfurtransferase